MHFFLPKPKIRLERKIKSKFDCLALEFPMYSLQVSTGLADAIKTNKKYIKKNLGSNIQDSTQIHVSHSAIANIYIYGEM